MKIERCRSLLPCRDSVAHPCLSFSARGYVNGMLNLTVSLRQREQALRQSSLPQLGSDDQKQKVQLFWSARLT